VKPTDKENSVIRMERNEYSPPSAPVFDIPNPDVPSDRPRQVSIAAMLLYASLALGVGTSVILAPRVVLSGPAWIIQVCGQVLTVIVIVWLTYKIWKGRNWARITFAVITSVGYVFYVPILMKMFRLSSVAGSINLLQSVLQLAALYLVFSRPGRAWFGARSITT
jgi:hypothetical protein